MKDTKATDSTAYAPIEVYRISKSRAVIVYTVDLVRRLILLGIGLYITIFVLYQQVLFNTGSNIVVTIFFCLLALICFEGFGVPISKFLNVVFSTAKRVSDTRG